MQTRLIIITDQDQQRLRELIRNSRYWQTEGREYLQALEKELDQAEVVEPQKVPADVITMNSTVRIREEGAKRGQTWTIVYPEHADVDANKISVLAPLGTALLGYRVGDTIEWEVPAGRRRFVVEKILHQPEASGDFTR